MAIRIQIACPYCVGFFVLLLCAIPSSTGDMGHSKSLLEFKKSLNNATMLDDWKEPVANVCSPLWTGCLCSEGVIRHLRLEGMGLGGKIDIESLSNLPLHSLSVKNNLFSGPFPNEINKLRSLRGLYLANNKFSGEIPSDAFSGMKRMKRVVMGNNELTGNIPISLLQLPALQDLQLQSNQFVGRIPDFQQQHLEVNFSYNKLEGPIPATLGNNNQNANSFSAAVAAGLVAIIILFLIFHGFARPLKYQKSIGKSQTEEQNFSQSGTFKTSEHGTLYFVRNDREKFELEELLRASAEVLGSGSFGSSYKTMLFNGQACVVRRFRQMNNVGKEEFYEHMRKLGMLSHPNVLPLIAFYYRKEEKLLINDFAENGSLASHLHSKKSPDQPYLDWPMRLKIIKGVARGLAYLYQELPNLTLPHGHLKSSNVLLDNTYEPLLADYALVPESHICK